MLTFLFLDIEECTVGLHNCNQICIELSGGFMCACNTGYELENDNTTCSGKTNITTPPIKRFSHVK